MKVQINLEEASEMLKNKTFLNLVEQYRSVVDDRRSIKEFLEDNPEFIQMACNYANKVVEDIEHDS